MSSTPSRLVRVLFPPSLPPLETDAVPLCRRAGSGSGSGDPLPHPDFSGGDRCRGEGVVSLIPERKLIAFG